MIPELMSHTIAIGLSIAVVVSLAAILNVFHEQNQSSIADMMSENICHQIKIAAEQLRPSSQPSTIQLALPNKIGNEPYTISSSNHTVSIISASASHICIIGTQAHLSGESSGATRLTLVGNGITISRV